jgi:O-antigen/teichoic acid export membrane protein
MNGPAARSRCVFGRTNGAAFIYHDGEVVYTYNCAIRLHSLRPGAHGAAPRFGGDTRIPREGRDRLSFIRNVTITFATKIFLFVISLITSIVVARSLGPEGKGLFSLAILAAAFTFNATNLGIGMGSGYFLGRRKVPLDELAGTWLSLSLVIGMSVLVLSELLAPYLVPLLLPSVAVWLVAVTLLRVPFSVLRFNFQSLFKAHNDFRRFNLVEIAQPVALLVLFTVAIFIVPGRKLEAAVVVYPVSYAVVGIMAVGLTAGLTRLRFRWSGSLVRAAMRFGVQGYLASFLGFLNLRLNLLLVNFFLEPAYVGYYSISLVMTETLWYIPDVLSVVLHPRVAHGGEDDANRETSIVSRQTVIIVLLGCIGVLLFGRFVIRLFYTDRFLPAAVPLFFLLPGVFANSLARVISSDLLARGYPRVILRAGVVSLATNVALNVALIPRFGIAGAAAATSVAHILNSLVIMGAFMSITGVAVRSIIVPGRDDLRLMIEGIRRLLREGMKRRH